MMSVCIQTVHLDSLRWITIKKSRAERTGGNLVDLSIYALMNLNRRGALECLALLVPADRNSMYN
jgi:hypothetical protein